MISNFRINAKGELEGRVIPPAKWEEMYTKEEVIAMLTELQSEIEELPTNRKTITDSSGFTNSVLEYEPTAIDASKLIQQKINALKENKDGSN